MKYNEIRRYLFRYLFPTKLPVLAVYNYSGFDRNRYFAWPVEDLFFSTPHV